jgi:putative hydrolase of the HAD superfamily
MLAHVRTAYAHAAHVGAAHVCAAHVCAVLFDAVGTVLDPHPPAATAYYEAGRRFGSQLPTTEVAQRYRAAFHRQEAEDRAISDGRTDEAREARRWRRIVTDVFDDVPDAEALFTHLWGHFASPANWRLFPDVAGAWKSLEQRSLTLGLASNFDARLAAVCRGFEPLRRCEQVFVSSQLGVRKPYPGFFAEIEAALGLSPRQIVLVGDSIENDYHAALAAGWQAVHVCRDESPPPDVVSITDLSQLVPLLTCKTD